MKRFLFFVLLAALVLSLAACGGAVVDYDTPKSGELSAAYDFYRDSQSSLASGMAITPEQADDVFLVLISCGMDSKGLPIGMQVIGDLFQEKKILKAAAAYEALRGAFPAAWDTVGL